MGIACLFRLQFRRYISASWRPLSVEGDAVTNQPKIEGDQRGLCFIDMGQILSDVERVAIALRVTIGRFFLQHGILIHDGADLRIRGIEVGLGCWLFQGRAFIGSFRRGLVQRSCAQPCGQRRKQLAVPSRIYRTNGFQIG